MLPDFSYVIFSKGPFTKFAFFKNFEKIVGSYTLIDGRQIDTYLVKVVAILFNDDLTCRVCSAYPVPTFDKHMPLSQVTDFEDENFIPNFAYKERYQNDLQYKDLFHEPINNY